MRSVMSAPSGMPALQARNVGVSYDGVRAVDGVSFHVDANEVFGLIGPNGAGKTTLMNVLSGFEVPTTGDVLVGGRVAKGWNPARFVRAGVGRTFQAVRPFPNLTVRENIEVGAIGTGVGRRAARRRADDLLGTLHLSHSADQPAGSLPHGELRRLGIARALAGEPKILLLDEPGAGANESEGAELIAALRAITSEFSCGFVVIEHDMGMIMSLCDRIHVLNFGQTICEGTPAEVQCDSAVIEAYLGHRETSS